MLLAAKGREFGGNRIHRHPISADDPRFYGTVRAIEKQLRRGNFLLRYDEEDEFGRPQTAFLTCTFWWIIALAQIGESGRARELFEAVLAARNPLGCFRRMSTPTQGNCGGIFRKPIAWSD